MSCSALKTNLCQCRNWSMLDSQYCYAHRSMTPEEHKKRWLQRYIVGPGESPIYTLLFPLEKEKILSDLKTHRVVLTKKDLQTIPAKEKYVDVYILLLEHNFAKYGDHPSLERMALWFYQRLLQNFPFDNIGSLGRNRLTILLEKIEQYIILTSGRSLYNFLMFIGMAVVGRSRLQQKMLEFIPTILDTQAAKELSWYSYDDLDEIRKEWVKCTKPNPHPLLRPLTERWLLDLKELYQTEKQIQKLQMNQCKEELMMDRWHPSRVEKMLNLGIDLEDM